MTASEALLKFLEAREHKQGKEVVDAQFQLDKKILDNLTPEAFNALMEFAREGMDLVMTEKALMAMMLSMYVAGYQVRSIEANGGHEQPVH